MAHEPGHEYDDWLKKQGGGGKWGNLTNKGKAGQLKNLASLADFGKKALGQEHLIDAKSKEIASTPPVKPGYSKKGDLSVQEDWKDDTSSVNTSPLSDADMEYQKKKKKNGLA